MEMDIELTPLFGEPPGTIVALLRASYAPLLNA